MHHHHPNMTPNKTSGSNILPTSSQTTSATTPTTSSSTQQRRRKKRPNYGTRTVEVKRGYNGFGFTISGQQPCRLSCIVKNSPADQAGLRAGDFLISVNGLNVSKLAHETVVQLIGNISSIRMQIAENYYSDSSDEENANALLMERQHNEGFLKSPGHLGLIGQARPKPRFLHHKAKMHRMRNSPQKKHMDIPNGRRPDLHGGVNKTKEHSSTLRPLMEDLPLSLQSNKPVVNTFSQANKITSASSSADVANVSAMVRVPTAALEYRAIVGYLGTIEMPKQISHSSKLQTVRSCIRKLRQEKRQPTTVLMTILPDCLKLQAANGNTLATYPSARLNYVSSSSESENRFFGLVTSAVHTTPIDDDDEMAEHNDENINNGLRNDGGPNAAHISISNSCHVFVVDIKLCDHPAHLPKANEFHVQCTRDPISNLCLEFPNNSEYVVNLIRSMYTMRILPPATRSANIDDYANNAMLHGGMAAHSPQPSNHSEVSTTTSNSDSGIGFHNDCNNISDRILVVDFPGAPLDIPNGNMRPQNARPLGIFNNLAENTPNHQDKRLTVRAMPDPKTPNLKARLPNLLDNFNLIKSPANCLNATRSCDDMLTLVEKSLPLTENEELCLLPPHASLDDLSLHTATTSTLVDDNHFLHPSCLERRLHNNYASDDYFDSASKINQNYCLKQTSLPCPVPDKLSPQVFGLNSNNIKANLKIKKPKYSLGIPSKENDVCERQPARRSLAPSSTIESWGSLQSLNTKSKNLQTQEIFSKTLETTNSEPDLGNRALPSNASPFRRAWAQSSLRTPRTDKSLQLPNSQQENSRRPLFSRTSSMTASDNDVYVKSMDGYINELKRTVTQQQIRLSNKTAGSMSSKIPQIKTEKPEILINHNKTDAAASIPSGVTGWGKSFEAMLQDPAGLHTFAQFLKKEFSAENIYFWTACERFRNIELEAEKAAQAKIIFDKHLAEHASDPVNVDSKARSLTENRMKNGEPDTFAPAQKQIFNLMQFDSYPRFIKSDLYKSCLDAEVKHQPLPYKGEDLDELLKTNFPQSASSKLKKSASNAEDRRRKSLLPWHRKTRSKSRDREVEDPAKLTPVFIAPAPPSTLTAPSKLPQLSSSSLKLPTTSYPTNEVYSSRSSLSSTDIGVSENTTLCRVILTDGATAVVQTKPDETVGQLVERLFEKRCLHYQFYDVVVRGTTKSINLQDPSFVVAGKEIEIEERVAFKLDLPDRKVISIKSKPKKQLHEVIRPILQKYNYKMEEVQVIMRETKAEVDLTLSVTIADGHRLQVIMLPSLCLFEKGNRTSSKNSSSVIPKSISFPNTLAKEAAHIALTLNNNGNGILPSLKTSSSSSASQAATPNNNQQSKLDEFTNKVYRELLQGKQNQQPMPNDLCSLKSDDCPSESSSVFDMMRLRDTSNIPSKLQSKKKSISSQNSEENVTTTTATQKTNSIPNSIATPLSGVGCSFTSSLAEIKKPIIAKLKAGVKLQVTERVAETQDELLEGLKRAQLARLEDQRGTEINFELPEFLKSKDSISAAASKLRKAREGLSPINKSIIGSQSLSSPPTPHSEYPQPAPRLSLSQKPKATSLSPLRGSDEEPSNGNFINPYNNTSTSTESSSMLDNGSANGNSITTNDDEDGFNINDFKSPPPLPPKPKVLPIKPSNWGVNTLAISANLSSNRMTASANLTPSSSSKIPIDIGRKHMSVSGVMMSHNSSDIKPTSTAMTSPAAASATATMAALSNSLMGSRPFLQETSSSFV